MKNKEDAYRPILTFVDSLSRNALIKLLLNDIYHHIHPLIHINCTFIVTIIKMSQNRFNYPQAFTSHQQPINSINQSPINIQTQHQSSP
jgi:hypothetical protein